MKIYHGGYITVEKPEIRISEYNKDMEPLTGMILLQAHCARLNVCDILKVMR